MISITIVQYIVQIADHDVQVAVAVADAATGVPLVIVVA